MSVRSPALQPDLAPSDYHLFLHMKRERGGQRFETDDEVKTVVDSWLHSLAVTFYENDNRQIDHLLRQRYFDWALPARKHCYRVGSQRSVGNWFGELLLKSFGTRDNKEKLRHTYVTLRENVLLPAVKAVLRAHAV
ncbi:hypothetical protein J6590_102429 [Homalodisca vitripennis]|nr:hypothetical protein J6590_102429 [Homalodisca vitripennis]